MWTWWTGKRTTRGGAALSAKCGSRWLLAMAFSRREPVDLGDVRENVGPALGVPDELRFAILGGFLFIVLCFSGPQRLRQITS